MYVQYLESILASVVFVGGTASFMNGCLTGHDIGVPSGSLINFLSKRDSELRDKRERRKGK